MVIYTIPTSDCTPQTIVIGRRTTHDTLQVVFDLSYLAETYGSGAAVLVVKRSQDTTAYPATITQDGNTLTWTITEVDTYYVGAGECELMWYVNNGLAKTIIYPVVVMRDILQTAEEPPDGYENWVEHLTELGAETQQHALDAAQSATEAETAQGKAEDAQSAAEAAQEAAEEAAERAETAIVHAPVIQGGYWYIWNDGQYVNTNVRAEGEKGDKGDTGEKGDTGNGIASITKTGTAGLVDTYTVTYTDGTTTTFSVTNGAKGDKGDTGATGNGIASITKTGTSGNVDTYTITYTNGQTTTFTVTNGAVTSVAGKTGAVTLDAGDVAFSGSATYNDGTVGKELSDQKNAISELNRQLSDFYIDNTISFSQNTLYKENTCIYPDGTEHSIQGYNTYKIPVKHGDGVFLKQSQSDPWFFGTITVPYQAGVIDSNNNYTAISNTSEIYKSSPTNREAYYLLSGDYVEMAFCIKAGTESTVKIWNGKTYANEISAPNVLNTDAFPSKIDKLNPIITQSFVNNELGITDLPRPYYVKTIYVSAGDSVSLSAKAGTLRFYGVYVNVKEKTADNITTSQYTFAADGVAFIFAHETEDINVYISSNNKVPVDFSQITNYPGGNWTGLSGVAFGTSLTERAKDYVGYLTYLPSLSGIAFDNQGRSSGEIMGVILTQIKAYTLYSSKSVCLLEGFVNDWYQGNELGTWKDTSETTVCGCVRSAINYIYQQNSSITLFLILDHYGRDNGGVNCASDAVNRNGLTQFEFYNEISKVAASLGVPVIKEYEYSQISENTPQYLVDNIHLTALGSQQSANYIWATMNNLSPNTI